MKKIFCVGLGKTGTTTFGVAMAQLGYHHCGFSARLLKHYADDKWDELLDTIKSFDSFDDFPWPLCYEWISDRFPESRFVLTLRATPEVWYQSLVRHGRLGLGTERNRLIAYGKQDPAEDQEYHLELYQRHRKDVEAYFHNQPERLLTVCWEKGDGWRELADFLETEVPRKPFPHANRHQGRARRGISTVARLAVRAFRNGKRR